MKTIRKIVSFPFIVIGVVVLFIGCLLLGGSGKTLAAFEAMKQGLVNAKKNS